MSLTELTFTICVPIVTLAEAFLKEGLLPFCHLNCPVEQQSGDNKHYDNTEEDEVDNCCVHLKSFLVEYRSHKWI